jgi:Dolichyl-phosphate-mannose-protein mannosyltransferase
MYFQPGSRDEECYAVPGLTVLSSGIPQLPHIPARNSESVFYGADKGLYCEPPIYFYVQAIFYAFLPDCYGTARFVSLTAGLLAAFLLVQINRESGGSNAAGIIAAGMFLFSRWFYFPAMMARPDFLCTCWGLAAVVCFLRWRNSSARKWLMATGVFLGLGCLTHAFALVYAIQLAVWAFIVSRGWRRCMYPGLLTLTTLAVGLLWLPLIWLHPEEFWIQFSNQYLTAHKDGFLHRLLYPGDLFWYHWLEPRGMLDHIGPIQSLLVIVPLIFWTIRSNWIGCPMRPICWLAISFIYLTTILVGPDHRVVGYWTFPAGLMFVGTGRFLDGLYGKLTKNLTAPRSRKFCEAIFTMLCVGVMIPGSGVKVLAIYWENRNRPEFNAPAFGRQLAETFPKGATIAVGCEFTLDFIVAGRKTLLAETLPFFFRLDQHACDYIVVSRHIIATDFAKQFPIELVRTAGLEDNIYACYAEVYAIRPRNTSREP